jgi:hypothetical protein
MGCRGGTPVPLGVETSENLKRFFFRSHFHTADSVLHRTHSTVRRNLISPRILFVFFQLTPSLAAARCNWVSYLPYLSIMSPSTFVLPTAASPLIC